MKLPSLSEKAFVCLLFVFNLGLRLFRLDSPNFAYFDERGYYLQAARDILAGKADPNYPHPPLSKELIALAIKFFGDNPIAWRGLQAILASLAIVTVYFIAKRLFSGRLIPTIAAFLMTFEFSWFVLSRLTIPEMFMISFFTFSLYFFTSFYQKKDNLSLILGSVFFGLALSSKWAVLLFVPVLVYTLLFRMGLKFKAKFQIWLIATLLVAISYLTPFLFLNQGNSTVEIVDFHRKAINFHMFDQKNKNLQKRDFTNSALFWPVDVYPLNWQTEKQGFVSTIIFLYNPAIVWGSLVAVFLFLKQFREKLKVDKDAFLSSGFLIFWLPWLFVPRGSYPYYLAVAVPFGAILVASLIAKYQKKYQWEARGLLLMVLALFLFYYPLLTKIPVKAWYLGLLTGLGF